jgi:hypothetical protein
MKMEQIECSETSAYKIQTPGNHPEENIQDNILLLQAVSDLHQYVVCEPYCEQLGCIIELG